MIRRIVGISFGLALLAAPIAASADAFTDATDLIRFLLSRTSGSLVGYDMSKPACMALTSTATPRVHEPFILVWGSWGAVDTDFAKNTWTPTGAYTVIVDEPGTRRYMFTFFGAKGAQASCVASVIVK